MNKIIVIIVFVLFAFTSTTSAQTYENNQYGFSLWLPDEYQEKSLPAPYWLACFYGKKDITMIGYIDTHGNYGYEGFDTTPGEQIQAFLQNQIIVSQAMTPQLKYQYWGYDYTITNKKYIYMVFLNTDSDIPIYTCRTYYKNGSTIICLFHIIPYSLKNSATDDINRSFIFFAESIEKLLDNQPSA